MKRYIEGFPSKLKGIDFKTLENSNHSIYGLSKELNLIYVNPGWIRFAKDNGEKDIVLKKFPLGAPIIKAFFGEKIKDYYINNYMKVLETGEPWHYEYECSSVDEFRQYHQDVYPLKDGYGLIIINALIVNLPMKNTGRKALEALDRRYVKSTGFVTQCSNCRCTQRADKPEIWDWVPDWVEKIPENFSHSICPICYDYHWKYDLK